MASSLIDPDQRVIQPLIDPDVLSRLLSLLGAQRWDIAARVCQAWLAAVISKAVEWRVLKSNGAALGEAASASCIVELGDGTLCLSDAHQLVLLAPDGTRLRTIGRRGHRFGEFERPVGLARDGERLFVVDRDAHRVQALHLPSGTPTHQAGGLGSRDGRLRGPRCAALAAGRLFVADTGNDRIACFRAADLSHEFCFGSSGSDGGQFDGPCGVASDGDQVVVADLCNHRLQIFNVDGSLMRVLGGRGDGAGTRFRGPWGVAIGGDHLFVAEMAARRVQVLSWPGCEVRQLLPLPAAAEMGVRGLALAAYRGALLLADPPHRRALAFPLCSARCLAALAPARAAIEAARAAQAAAGVVAVAAAAATDDGGDGDDDKDDAGDGAVASAPELTAPTPTAEEENAWPACALALSQAPHSAAEPSQRARRLRGVGFEVAEEEEPEEATGAEQAAVWRRLQIEEELEDEEDEDEEIEDEERSGSALGLGAPMSAPDSHSASGPAYIIQ